ncbi:hypothetical protein GBAR_LOCUS17451 [Geodia barretti]|uniref:Uncharacterized protein n=1 Tax=Geodia barretti TaxID=519541 RepID=A0AA35WXY3_GEOBA|nr:hypothetical protein GBAR_LOCUS17451 [Geodia barretti]
MNILNVCVASQTSSVRHTRGMQCLKINNTATLIENVL